MLSFCSFGGRVIPLAISCPPACPKKPGSQWVVVRKRKHSPKFKPVVHHWPVLTYNRFSSLSDIPAEENNPGLLLRNLVLETPATIVKCISGARAGDVESYLKLLAKDKRKYSKIVIHVSGNDTLLCQSKVTRIYVRLQWFNRMSSFNRWLSG